MVNYQNGKIYKIEPICEYLEGEIYIGSTTKEYLSQRFQEHKRSYKLWLKDKIRYNKIMVYEIFDKYDVENCHIVLLDKYPSNSKDELFKKEGEYIKNNKCLNRTIMGRTRKEYKRDYSKTKPEKVQQFNKTFYQKHKEEIIQRVHLYAENNKDKIKERGIIYRQEHKEEIKARKSKKEICDICGTQYAHNHKQRHLRSKFCQNVKANRI